MNAQRGQTLPLWIGGILTSFALMFFMLNYAYLFSWQVRAQNAADAAAQAVVSLQTQQWNEMTELLYASAIEEYRIRNILDGMYYASHGSGGCWQGPGDPTGGVHCNEVFSKLETAFFQASNRYTNDAIALNSVTSTSTVANVKSDAAKLVTYLQAPANCGGGANNGFDCSFEYTFPVANGNANPTTRTNLLNVKMTAQVITLPHYTLNRKAATFNTGLFAPIAVEIAACDKNVPSLVSIVGSFFGIKGGTTTISALGTATAVSVEQDWLQPGQILDPNTGSWYQPDEGYGLPAYWDTFNNYEWYQTHFGGNPFVADPIAHTYTLNIVDNEFSVQTSWWNAIPYPPFVGALTQAQVCP